MLYGNSFIYVNIIKLFFFCKIFLKHIYHQFRLKLSNNYCFFFNFFYIIKLISRRENTSLINWFNEHRIEFYFVEFNVMHSLV